MKFLTNSLDKFEFFDKFFLTIFFIFYLLTIASFRIGVPSILLLVKRTLAQRLIFFSVQAFENAEPSALSFYGFGVSSFQHFWSEIIQIVT